MNKNTFILLLLVIPFLSNGSSQIEALKDSLPFYSGQQKAIALFNIGTYYLVSNNDSTLFYMEKALQEYEELNDEKGVASSYGMLAAVYGEYGIYDTAIALHYKVIEWGEKNQDIRAFIAYLELGNTYKDIGQIEKSKTFYQKTIQGDYLPAKRAAFANMGLIFLDAKEYDSALFYFEGGLNEYYRSDTSLRINKYNIASILLNLASVAYGKEEFDKGNNLLFRSLAVSREIENNSLTASAYLKLGEGYHLVQQDDVSMQYYMKAKSMADSLGLLLIQEKVYMILSDFYHDKGDYDQAYFNLIEYHKIHDSLIEQANQSSIIEMEVKYAVQEKIVRIAVLNREKKMFIGLGISIVAGILLIVGFIILLLNRRRLRLKNDRDIAEAKMQAEKIKAKTAKQELKRIVVSLGEKSAFIEELEHEIQQLSIDDEQQRMEEKVLKLRETRILTDGDWEEYFRIFNEIYPSFFSREKDFYELSTGDKRQLVFLKLGLTQIQTAHLMGISPEGVKKARQRLAKKIGMNDTKELKGYIESL